jgi:hypothetical protein
LPLRWATDDRRLLARELDHDEWIAVANAVSDWERLLAHDEWFTSTGRVRQLLSPVPDQPARGTGTSTSVVQITASRNLKLKHDLEYEDKVKPLEISMKAALIALTAGVQALGAHVD